MDQPDEQLLNSHGIYCDGVEVVDMTCSSAQYHVFKKDGIDELYYILSAQLDVDKIIADFEKKGN